MRTIARMALRSLEKDALHVIGDQLAPPLRGSRRSGRLAVFPLDFSEPVDPTAFYKNVLRPALVRWV
jgi:hypothetical protein